jgi:phosphoglucosamine mutase
MSAERLFGTDGIRERAGEGALTAANIVRLGCAIATAARKVRGMDVNGPILIGRDPRPSGEAITRDLARGFLNGSTLVDDAGVIPTPGISYLVRRHKYALGIVISASHNPPEYNGIKVFEADGTKSGDDLERAIEAAYAESGAPLESKQLAEAGGAPPPLVPEKRAAYADALVALAGKGALRGRSVVLDCANGATGATAAATFRALGADVTLLNAEMDGARINDGCGALHPDVAAAAVRERRAAAGFSFDGDGDRVIAIDEKGVVHDGDDVLYALARFLEAKGELPGATVVATVLSNMGLEVALKKMGVKLERVPVGDRHVSQRLIEGGFALGGEQSGHVVLPRVLGPTGDGIACAIELLRAASELDQPLSALLTGFRRFPQVAKNVRVREKPKLETLVPVQDAIGRANGELAGRGRLLVRYSGTEPLARVMVEAEDAALTERVAGEVAAVLAREIGLEG